MESPAQIIPAGGKSSSANFNVRQSACFHPEPASNAENMKTSDDDLLTTQKCNCLQMRGRYSDQNYPIMIKKKSSVIEVLELQWCIYVVLLGDLQAALETAVFTDNFSHIIKDNPSLWGNLPRPRSQQKDPSASKSPPVGFGQQESKQQQKKRGRR